MCQVISRDGTTIGYSRKGQGSALILVHGALAYRAINLTEHVLVELLAPLFTVYTYDRRGRGESGDTAPYSVEREIDDLEAIIARHADGQAMIFGRSSGGLLALDAAANGLQVTKVAMYEPPLDGDFGHPPLSVDHLMRVTELLSEGRRGEAVERYLQDVMHLPAEEVADLHSRPLWPEFERIAPTLAYDAAVVIETLGAPPVHVDRWAELAVPTIVITSGLSPARVQSRADALVEQLPIGSRCTLEQPANDNTEEALAAVLAEFFADR